MSNTAKLLELKNKAKSLGITFHPSISYDVLEERINNHLDKNPAIAVAVSGQDKEREVAIAKMNRMREASRLHRVNITPLNPAEKQLPGRVYTAGNREIGFHKQYIPYGVDWHVRKIVLEMLKGKTYTELFHVEGQMNKARKQSKAFDIVELDPLTTEEMKILARNQAGKGTQED